MSEAEPAGGGEAGAEGSQEIDTHDSQPEGKLKTDKSRYR